MPTENMNRFKGVTQCGLVFVRCALFVVLSLPVLGQVDSPPIPSVGQIITRLKEIDAESESLTRKSAVHIESVTDRVSNGEKITASRNISCRRRGDNLLAVVERSGSKGNTKIVSCLNADRSYYFRIHLIPGRSDYEVKELEIEPDESSEFDLSHFFRARVFYRTIAGESLAALLSKANGVEITEIDGELLPIKISGNLLTGNYRKLELVVFRKLNLAVGAIRIDFRGNNEEESITTRITYGVDNLPSVVEIRQRTLGVGRWYEENEILNFREFKTDMPPPEIFELENYGIRSPAKMQRNPLWLIAVGMLLVVLCWFFWARMRKTSKQAAH
ncbi:MAG: hypothetical protein ACK56W_21840 [Pirellula sp.]|nr:hypothetical protein [Pirellula sp.]